jgi:tetratricopeptide (TPR) repeat protein
MRTAIGPSCARRSNGWPASNEVIGVKISFGLLGLGLALLPGAPFADPRDETPKEGQLDPDYAAGKAAIAGKDWKAAIRSLSSAALRDTRNADIENYLGYAYRQSGQLQLAFAHYERALQLNPRHRGAHEYIGEAYLMANNLTKAEEHLAALQRICLIPCEEYEDLKKAVTEYRARAAK